MLGLEVYPSINQRRHANRRIPQGTPSNPETRTKTQWAGPTSEKDSEAVLGVWLPAPLTTPRALPDHGAILPLAVGVEKDLGGIDV